MTWKPLAPLTVGLVLLAPLGSAQDLHGSAAALEAPTTEAMTTLDGAFTQAQADRGQEVYVEHCAACHGGNLRGKWNLGPSIAGFRFERRWVELTVFDLFDYLKQTMPKGDLGRLTDPEYAGVLAYLLLRNGYPVGTTVDIPVDPAAQALITIVGR